MARRYQNSPYGRSGGTDQPYAAPNPTVQDGQAGQNAVPFKDAPGTVQRYTHGQNGGVVGGMSVDPAQSPEAQANAVRARYNAATASVAGTAPPTQLAAGSSSAAPWYGSPQQLDGWINQNYQNQAGLNDETRGYWRQRIMEKPGDEGYWAGRMREPAGAASGGGVRLAPGAPPTAPPPTSNYGDDMRAFNLGPMVSPNGGVPQGMPYNPVKPPPEAAYTPNLGRPGLNANAPTYQAQNVAKWNAPDLSGLTSTQDALLGQVTNGPMPTYNAAQIGQYQNVNFGPQQNQQDALISQILGSPTFDSGYTNALNEQQKELIMQRGREGSDAMAINAAHRGVTNGGAYDAAMRRSADEQTRQLLQSQRDVSLQTTGANRQSLLDAIGATSAAQQGRVGMQTQQFGAQLAGQQASAAEAAKVYQSQLDSVNNRYNALNAASGVLGSRAGIASDFYRNQLAGDQAAAGEQRAAYQSQADAVTSNRARDALLEQLSQAGAASQLGLAQFREGQNQFGSTFGENQRQFGANFGENQRQYDTSLANNQNQFGQTLRNNQSQFGQTLANNQYQFGQNFGENQRQFNENLANNVNQFGQNIAQQRDLANQRAYQDYINLMTGGA